MLPLQDILSQQLYYNRFMPANVPQENKPMTDLPSFLQLLPELSRPSSSLWPTHYHLFLLERPTEVVLQDTALGDLLRLMGTAVQQENHYDFNPVGEDADLAEEKSIVIVVDCGPPLHVHPPAVVVGEDKTKGSNSGSNGSNYISDGNGGSDGGSNNSGNNDNNSSNVNNNSNNGNIHLGDPSQAEAEPWQVVGFFLLDLDGLSSLALLREPPLSLPVQPPSDARVVDLMREVERQGAESRGELIKYRNMVSECEQIRLDRFPDLPPTDFASALETRGNTPAFVCHILGMPDGSESRGLGALPEDQQEYIRGLRARRQAAFERRQSARRRHWAARWAVANIHPAVRGKSEEELQRADPPVPWLSAAWLVPHVRGMGIGHAVIRQLALRYGQGMMLVDSPSEGMAMSLERAARVSDDDGIGGVACHMKEMSLLSLFRPSDE